LAMRVNSQRMTNRLRIRECARKNASIPHWLALARSGRYASGPNATDSHGGRAAGLGVKRRGRSVHHVHCDGQRKV